MRIQSIMLVLFIQVHFGSFMIHKILYNAIYMVHSSKAVMFHISREIFFGGGLINVF